MRSSYYIVAFVWQVGTTLSDSGNKYWRQDLFAASTTVISDSKCCTVLDKLQPHGWIFMELRNGVHILEFTMPLNILESNFFICWAQTTFKKTIFEHYILHSLNWNRLVMIGTLIQMGLTNLVYTHAIQYQTGQVQCKYQAKKQNKLQLGFSASRAISESKWIL